MRTVTAVQPGSIYPPSSSINSLISTGAYVCLQLLIAEMVRIWMNSSTLHIFAGQLLSSYCTAAATHQPRHPTIYVSSGFAQCMFVPLCCCCCLYKGHKPLCRRRVHMTVTCSPALTLYTVHPFMMHSLQLLSLTWHPWHSSLVACIMRLLHYTMI